MSYEAGPPGSILELGLQYPRSKPTSSFLSSFLRQGWAGPKSTAYEQSDHHLESFFSVRPAAENAALAVTCIQVVHQNE